MKACRGGRSAGSRRAMRCGSQCRAAVAGAPGEPSARTFERALADLAGAAIAAAEIVSELRPGAGYVRVTVAVSVAAAGVGARWPSRGTPSATLPETIWSAGRSLPHRPRSSRTPVNQGPAPPGLWLRDQLLGSAIQIPAAVP